MLKTRRSVTFRPNGKRGSPKWPGSSFWYHPIGSLLESPAQERQDSGPARQEVDQGCGARCMSGVRLGLGYELP